MLSRATSQELEKFADAGVFGPNASVAVRNAPGRFSMKTPGDAAAYAWLFDRLPEISAFIRCAELWAVSDFDLLGGPAQESVEEAQFVYASLAGRALAGRYIGGSFTVRLDDATVLVGLDAQGVAGICSGLGAARRAHRAHLLALGVATELHVLGERPIIGSGKVPATCAESSEHEALSVFVLPEWRGRGIGDRIVERWVAHAKRVVVHDACDVLGFYEERGYRQFERRLGLTWLMPPTERAELIAAASVCLLEPISRQVLIGRRLTQSWHGYWAFPGGRVEPGEASSDAALRELSEETGIALPAGTPVLRTRVYAGSSEHCFAIDNYCFLTLERPEPRKSAELDARWVALPDALKLRPLAAGARRVLRRVIEELTGHPTAQ